MIAPRLSSPSSKGNLSKGYFTRKYDPISRRVRVIGFMMDLDTYTWAEGQALLPNIVEQAAKALMDDGVDLWSGDRDDVANRGILFSDRFKKYAHMVLGMREWTKEEMEAYERMTASFPVRMEDDSNE